MMQLDPTQCIIPLVSWDNATITFTSTIDLLFGHMPWHDNGDKMYMNLPLPKKCMTRACEMIIWADLSMQPPSYIRCKHCPPNCLKVLSVRKPNPTSKISFELLHRTND